MASSPNSHRSTQSTSTAFVPASVPNPFARHAQQRRMTSPSSLPPPAPLGLPEPVERRDYRRPPSPLRNSVTMDPRTGEFSEDGSMAEEDEDRESTMSPTPSMGFLASNIAQKFGSLVSNISPRGGAMPTDAELEAESERAREKSRREAERILNHEAQERKVLEERVLALLHNPKTPTTAVPPPPPIPESKSNPPSPSSSQKEGSNWFAAVKNKLTPAKEPLTPAQQIILDTKARDKEKEKDKKKEKGKDREWPAPGNNKFTDPAFLALSSAASAAKSPTTDAHSPPTSPTPPPRQLPFQSVATPSPIRSVPSAAPSATGSPSREPPPFYAQFDEHGSLDVATTLLAIAKRFEKLEKWAVSHVRALEDRMGDVERWLVDKEKEKEAQNESQSRDPPSNAEMGVLRDELAEMQGRISELGREMAKWATSAPNLNSGPTRNTVASVTVTPTSIAGPSYATRALPVAPVSTPRANTGPPPAVSQPVHDTPSPPASSSAISARTRLPYPTGDYTAPPGSVVLNRPFSPTNSPPASLTEATRRRPVSVAGLPTSSSGNSVSMVSSHSGLSTFTPTGLPSSPDSKLSPPSTPVGLRVSSYTNTSPTPRKRYTVALGAPLVAPRDDDNMLSTSPLSQHSSINVTSEDGDDDDETWPEHGHSREDTVGKSTISMPSSNGSIEPKTPVSRQWENGSPNLRIRAQSSYGSPTSSMLTSYTHTNGTGSTSVLAPNPNPVTPVKPRIRSRSTDRLGHAAADKNINGSSLGLGLPTGMGPSAGAGAGKFVDPLVMRREKASTILVPKTPKVTNPRSKVPVGELVAFFDKS